MVVDLISVSITSMKSSNLRTKFTKLHVTHPVYFGVMMMPLYSPPSFGTMVMLPYSHPTHHWPQLTMNLIE